MAEQGRTALGEGRLSPWLDVCIRPRATLRVILDEDPDRHVLALLTGPFVVGLLLLALVGADDTSFWLIGAGLLVGLVLPGYLAWIWLYSAAVAWGGRRFGGVGTWRHVRAAVAWSHVPVFVCTAGLPIALAMVLTSDAPDVESWSIGARIAGFIVAGIWQLMGIAAAHQFSITRAVGAWLAGMGALLLGGLAFVILLRAVFSRQSVADWLAGLLA